MHDNPLDLRPFNGPKDYFAFFLGKGSYWYRQRQITGAKQTLAEQLAVLDTFPSAQREKLLAKYNELKGMRAKTAFIERLQGAVRNLKAERSRSVAGQLPQDTLKRIERMPAAQQEAMKEYYLKKLYGKDFEKHLAEDTDDEMADALLGV